MQFMEFNLRSALPIILPKAITWAESQSTQIMHFGQPLENAHLDIARSVGVMHPAKIRIMEVDCLPFPDDSDLKQAAQTSGLLSENAAGLTLGYGIYVRRGYGTIRLFSHEFRHVYQYEDAGSISAFLSAYLQQIMTFGYENAPLEMDARAHEKSIT
jgi:hypothetical protein